MVEEEEEEEEEKIWEISSSSHGKLLAIRFFGLAICLAIRFLGWLFCWLSGKFS